jgi:hypothetical protein
MLVVTLCMVCPFDAREKQALLEAGTPEEPRGACSCALLQMDTHGMAPDTEAELETAPEGSWE